MKNKFFRLQRLKKQLKKLVAVPFLIIGLVLLVLAILKPPAVIEAREKIVSFFVPLTSALSYPVQYVRQTGENVGAYLNVLEENKQLKAEITRLKSWHKTALKLSMENQELAKLLNYRPVLQEREFVVRVLADYNSPFAQSFIISGGQNIGVRKGNVLVSNEGLIGIVHSVGKTTARALKVTDYYARLPVYIGEDRYLAIMSGDNSRYPHITALPAEYTVSAGDYVMTAGVAGAYPAGIPVGLIKSVDDGEITVDLFENNNNLEFVRVVDFSSSALLPDECAVEEAQ